MSHARAGLAVFDSNVVVPCAGAEALDLGLHRLSRLELLQVHEVLPAGLREAVERARRARLERESYDDVGPGGLAVQHEEVVFVHAARDCLPAGVFQAMLQHQRVVDEPHPLPIDVRIT